LQDPHVVNLRYKLITPETTTYKNPPIVKGNCDEFNYCLDNGVLICEMQRHFSTIKKTQEVIEVFLRSWEIQADLKIGYGEVRFQYEDACLIDRKPSLPGKSKVVNLSGTVIISSNASAKLYARRNKYPDPPTTFKVTQDVKNLWQRYKAYLKGKEPLLSMAYYCLTFLENKISGRSRRRNAANLFLIDKEILNTLGNLTTNRGDPVIARKAPENEENSIALTMKEKKWIESAVKIIIFRMGELSNKQKLKKITMNDLLTL